MRVTLTELFKRYVENSQFNNIVEHATDLHFYFHKLFKAQVNREEIVKLRSLLPGQYLNMIKLIV